MQNLKSSKKWKRGGKGEDSPCYGKKLTPEHKEKIRLAGIGRRNTEETKRKMSESAKKRGALANARISAAMRGKKFSDEHRANLSKAKKGKNTLSANNNWRGGISFIPYPLGWSKTFKEQIRYRDGYKCQVCGTPETENGKKLDVHHIDYDKHNLEERNLVSLCVKCHRKTNHNRELWQMVLSRPEV